MKPQFLGNLGTKTLHALGYTDGRCHLGQIRIEQQKEFFTLEEAMNYPDKENPVFHKCGVCFPKMKAGKRS